MSKKINNYVILDFETGGLDFTKNPIVEFACVAILGTTYEQIFAYDNIIKPYDPNLIYEEQAFKVHGISKEQCQREGIPLSQFIQDFITICEDANTENSKIGKPILVRHNPTFDESFLCDVMINRGKIDLSKYLSGYTDYKGHFHPHYIDTLQLCKNVEGHSQDKAIKFNLGECARRMGIEVIDGHRAMNDVIPTKEVFVNLMTRLRSNGSSSFNVETGVATHRDKFEI